MNVDIEELLKDRYILRNNYLKMVLTQLAGGIITTDDKYVKHYQRELKPYLNKAPKDIANIISYISDSLENRDYIKFRLYDDKEIVDSITNYDDETINIGLISDFHVNKLMFLKSLEAAFDFYNENNIKQVYCAGDLTNDGFLEQARLIANVFCKYKIKYPEIMLDIIFGNNDGFDKNYFNQISNVKQFKPFNIGQYKFELTHYPNRDFNEYLTKGNNKIVVNGHIHPVQSIVRKPTGINSNIGIVLPSYNLDLDNKYSVSEEKFFQILKASVNDENKVTRMDIYDINGNPNCNRKIIRRKII